jgi:hypothetical protein
MDIIRKIVQQELLKALLEMRNPVLQTSGEEQIIYDFDAGRAFGQNRLANDIHGLDKYYMTDYFPRSEIEEGWMFEIESNYGGSQLVEISHRIGAEYNSFWNLRIAEVERGSDQPQIIAETGHVEEYQTFIERVNSTLGDKIGLNFS